MKIIIIGSVAAGTSVAAKARRNDEDAEITLYNADYDISYSICGIPYFLGGEVDELETLTPRSAAWFKVRYNVDIHTRHEVTSINPEKKTVIVKNLDTNETKEDHYDTLVFATGATPITPKIDGVDRKHVFHVRTIQNTAAINEFMNLNNPKKVTIIGAGFIGLEMAEQLTHKGLDVTIVQRSNQIMPHLDKDMAFRVEEHLRNNGVKLLLNEEASVITEKAVETKSGKMIDSEIVILATGVKPNTKLATEIGIEIGSSGAIKVNNKMQTNLPDVYAVGDVAESFSLITGKPIYRPLGSTANKMGRIAGDVITGGNLEHKGILGTGILRVFDLTVGYTGLSEKEALAEGFDIEVLHNIKPARADYLGGKELVIKAIADRKTSQILGVQIIGEEGVDKRIDVFVTAISFKARAGDLFHLDLAYAPPFSTTKDPVMYTGMALQNAIDKKNRLITPQELTDRIESGEKFQIIDTRATKQYEVSNVDGAINIPLAKLRSEAQNLDPNLPTVTYCNSGVTGNAAQNVLRNLGFKEVFNLSGGNKNYQSFNNGK
ncbi:Pyridine nucleotide-disulfide oxidoreductase [Caldibacillus thermoamylovorans]|uniref:Pyridine nucleotide-disulfide oxidoreductase n=1 Tax=Caldibacillus thermoamylovorans TaxID=35841 RepID=A0A0D0FBW6_9BACI|nr:MULTISPECIES: FAD-dependent oxidoreductase [Bacillaceae]MCB5936333.1 FAD-dependent oxidoreductase [Bacillus sp. DFI.2.34]AWI12621.1 dehydrogenase [Caldibacillus thermoamylovorans]KIO66250.1 Pyridine nucleotide-disulfide oxidoreductase [Caldibacillus thermoamylovorans]KIO66467.1 Pyridine nucleotide-disulfide oxidoreductase [Caldibacillus thermoamylovorans]KIO69604.1 Pyridine nucleotide-disulfide oxidoreductase [Caldibacillus thermoamylovorans]